MSFSESSQKSTLVQCVAAAASLAAVAAAGALFVASDRQQIDSRQILTKSVSLRGVTSRRQTWQRMVRESLKEVEENSVTFDEFPYFLEDKTREMVKNAAFVHLQNPNFRTYAQTTPYLMITGEPGSELYQEALTMALASHYKAKTLSLDIPLLLASARMERGLLWSPVPNKPKEALVARASADVMEALVEVLTVEAKLGPIIFFIRDLKHVLEMEFASKFIQKMKKLTGKVFVIGSNVTCKKCDHKNAEELISQLFSSSITIKAPSDETALEAWKTGMEGDKKILRSLENRKALNMVMLHSKVACYEMEKLDLSSFSLDSPQAEEVLGWAVSHYLMDCQVPDMQDGSLLLPLNSLEYGLQLSSAHFEEGREEEGRPQGQTEPKELQDSAGKTDLKVISKVDAEPSLVEKPKGDLVVPEIKPLPDSSKPSTSPSTPPPVKKAPTVEVVPDNEFEKRIRPEVIPADGVGVTFDSIGALDNVKDSLRELVMLPLQRPELFNRGGLIQPCKGILLFGPPGTGKTMLAKAVATEAGANFINISMSTITSKWFGEDEKNVRALFSLATKLAPTVIFIDEVDSMLGRRSRAGEHEAMRKIKNEFMAHWDGLLSKGSAGVLVLAATNRPFDLDEAIIRRFQRRIMVGLPDVENREKILRSILAKEDLASNFDFKELAVMTEGHSGSDLKNLCITAAYRPIRELLEAEKKKKIASEKLPTKVETKAVEEKDGQPENVGQAEKLSDEEKNGEQKVSTEGQKEAPESTPVEEAKLRPLCMEDLRQAKSQFAASVATEGVSMGELQEWNELYGEGGTRKKTTLSYFL